MATRCFWPPESWLTILSAESCRSTSASSSSARLRRVALSTPRTSSPKAMFSQIGISGNSARFWKISAVGRWFGRWPFMSLPPMRITPSVGSVKPEIIRRMVVLPQPDGPEEGKELTRLDVDIHMVNRPKISEIAADIIEINPGTHGRILPRGRVCRWFLSQPMQADLPLQWLCDASPRHMPKRLARE